METQHFKRNLLLNFYREEKKYCWFVFSCCLRDKNVWHLQPISSVWRPRAFLPVTLSPSPVISTTGCFCCGSISSFFLELFLHWSPVSYSAPTALESSCFSILSFCLFMLFMGFLRQEYWSRLPLWASLVAQMVKHLPTMQETRFQLLHWEDPLEKEMAAHPSILAWEIPWTEDPDSTCISKESDTTEQLHFL